MPHAASCLARSRGAAAAMLVGCAGIGLGAVLPAYFATVGSHVATVATVPMGLGAALLFLGDRRRFLLVVLAGRSACDLLFESARGAIGGGLGPGALVNAAVIAVAAWEAARPSLTHVNLAAHKPILLAWCGFFATCIYGIALSPEPGAAIRLTLAWASNFAVFYCALCYTRSPADFQSHVDLIIGSSLIPLAYGAYQVLLAGTAGRVAATFTHPNIFAFYLVLVIALLFYRLKHGGTRMGVPWRIAGLAYFALLAAMLALTQTRSAWLACSLLFVGYGLRHQHRYLVYIGCACALALLADPVRERLLDLQAPEVTTGETKINSLSWRFELWSAALAWMAPARAVLGHGIGAFSHHAPEFFRGGDGIHWDAHNAYVQWFFDTGVVGLLGYLWLQLRLLRGMLGATRQQALLRHVAAATVVGYLAVALSDNMMFYLAYNWYYWFFAGTALAELSRALPTGIFPGGRPMVER